MKLRDQRIPRMTDLTMRPFFSGKKTTGSLEVHTNGLRFTSKKHEIVDVIYANIKHCLFQVNAASNHLREFSPHFLQPCENEVMEVLCNSLSEKVVDASVALDSARRSMYDPDELDEEQQERSLRKKLNEMRANSALEISCV